jgi:hypothetical protein
MTKRPTLRSVMPSEAAQAAAVADELQRRQEKTSHSENVAMTTSTIHMPAELLNALRAAANRRSMRRITRQLDDGKGTRPSVSEMVVEMLTKHRSELDQMD